MMTIFEFIGYIGVAIYVASYALLATQKLTGESAMYHSLNLIAPCCIIVSLYDAFNAPSAVIQSIWIAISLTALFRILKLKNACTKKEIT